MSRHNSSTPDGGQTERINRTQTTGLFEDVNITSSEEMAVGLSTTMGGSLNAVIQGVCFLDKGHTQLIAML